MPDRLPLSTARPASSVPSAVAGSPLTLPVSISDESGAPVSFTGRAVTYEARTASGALHAEGVVDVTDAASGKGTVTLGGLYTVAGGVVFVRVYVKTLAGVVLYAAPAGGQGIQVAIPGAGTADLTTVRQAVALAPEAIRAARLADASAKAAAGSEARASASASLVALGSVGQSVATYGALPGVGAAGMLYGVRDEGAAYEYVSGGYVFRGILASITLSSTAALLASRGAVGATRTVAGQAEGFDYSGTNPYAYLTTAAKLQAAGILYPAANGGFWARAWDRNTVQVGWQAKADGVTDDSAALQACIDLAGIGGAFKGGAVLDLPAGSLRMAARLNVRRSVTLRGAGWGFYAGTTLLVDDGVAGPEFERDTTSADGGDGQFSTLENIRIEAAGKTVPNRDGLTVRTTHVEMRNVYVKGFSRHGVHIVGGTGFGPGGQNTNADFNRANGLRIEDCGGDGMFVEGNDGQAGVFTLVDAVGCGGVAIRDVSLIGNLYISCHSLNNAGGAFYLTSDSSTSQLLACYSEFGNAPSKVLAPNSVVGGNHGAGFTADSTGAILQHELSGGYYINGITGRSPKGAGGYTGKYVQAQIGGQDPNVAQVLAWKREDDTQGFKLTLDNTNNLWRLTSEITNPSFDLARAGNTLGLSDGTFIIPREFAYSDGGLARDRIRFVPLDPDGNDPPPVLPSDQPGDMVLVLGSDGSENPIGWRSKNDQWVEIPRIPLRESLTYNWPSIADGAQAFVDIALPGVAFGDHTSASLSVPLQGLQIWSEVYSTTTPGPLVRVYLRNGTGSAVDLASCTVSVAAVRHVKPL